MNKREIKYRFRLKMLEESWGGYTKGDIDFFFISLLDEQNGLVRFPIDKQWEIVSCDEYIGVKDKNGKDVYVNDIVDHRYTESDGYGKIIWDKDNFSFTLHKLNYQNWSNHEWYETNSLEVVGNIYDNKNLLNQ